MADNDTILVFCCENSALKAVDSMDNTALRDSVDIIKLPCSGKIETGFVLKCFEKGCGGVIILGCPLDNCKFLKGNYRARKRVAMIKKSLHKAGINENRVTIDFVSSVDTHKVVNIIEEMKISITEQRIQK